MADDDDDLNDFKMPPASNEDADAQLDAKALKLVEEYVASLNKSKTQNDIRMEIRGNIGKLGINTLAFQHELTALRMMDKADRSDYMTGRRRMGRILADKQDTLFPEDLERIKKRKAKAKELAAKEAAKMGGESVEAQERRLAADADPRNDPKTGGAGGKVNGRGKAKDTPAKHGRKPKEAVAPATAVDRAIETAERQQRLREAQEAGPGASATIHDTVAAGDALISSAAAQLNAAAEQATGDSILSAHIAEMDKRANEHTVPETEGVDATGLTGKPMSQSEIAAQKMREAGLA